MFINQSWLFLDVMKTKKARFCVMYCEKQEKKWNWSCHVYVIEKIARLRLISVVDMNHLLGNRFWWSFEKKENSNSVIQLFRYSKKWISVIHQQSDCLREKLFLLCWCAFVNLAFATRKRKVLKWWYLITRSNS